MSTTRIAPFPAMTAELLGQFARECEVAIAFASEVDPGARHLETGVTTFGTDSEWSPGAHLLHAEVVLSDLRALRRCFGPAGLVATNARIGLVLEWTSVSSDRRGLGLLVPLQADDCREWPLRMEVTFPANSVRGVLALSVELFLIDPGEHGPDELHLAKTPGSRLGPLGPEWTLVFDGDATVFPIVPEPGRPDGPLWELRQRWDDPARDEFEEHLVSLVLNERHPHFSQLGIASKPPLQTPLFRQVLAGWISLLVLELRRTDEEIFQCIVRGDESELAPGSIARAVSHMVRVGSLETATEVALLRSAQVWLEHAMGAPSENP